MTRAVHCKTPGSACEVREVRRLRSTRAVEIEDVTYVDRFFADEDPTTVERRFAAPETDFTRLSAAQLEELRARLRAAEAREDQEGSGIRARSTPEDGLPFGSRGAFEGSEGDLEAAIEELADLDIEVEEPISFEEWSEAMGALPEIEVSIAPRSDSNFYGGFDEQNPDGVFLATYRRLAVDTPVYVAVYLPGGYRFRTPALVEFVREPEASTPELPAGVGLRMCGLDARMRRMIREFVKRRPPLFYVG